MSTAAGGSSGAGSGGTGTTGTGTSDSSDSGSESTGAAGCGRGHINNPNGSCTATLVASLDPGLEGIVRRVDDPGSPCVVNPPEGPVDDGAYPQWNIQAQTDLFGWDQIQGFITFDTQDLPASLVVEARVVIQSNNFTGTPDVDLWGGPQPVFGDTLMASHFGAGNTLLGTLDSATIDAAGFADFPILPAQVNLSGYTQFRIAVATTCPSGSQSVWSMHNVDSAGLEPTLEVRYEP